MSVLSVIVTNIQVRLGFSMDTGKKGAVIFRADVGIRPYGLRILYNRVSRRRRGDWLCLVRCGSGSHKTADDGKGD